VVHTLLSLVAVVAALVALVREGGVSRRNGVYVWSLVATCLTGLPIFRHGTIGPPHIAGVLTLAVFALAFVAGRTSAFGRASGRVETIAYWVTLLLLGISTVTETLTRVPPSAPLVASPDAGVLKVLDLGLLILFVIGLTRQLRRQRAS
jgi:hypothetical protein